MDALRRAETPADEATDETSATAEQTTATATESSAADLSLEPLNDVERQSEARQQHSGEDRQQQSPDDNASIDSERPDESGTVKRSHVVLEPRSSRTQNILMFISGLAFILLIVGSYYAWKSSELPAQRGFSSATLIDSPETPEVSQNELAQNETASVTKNVTAQKTTTTHRAVTPPKHAPDLHPAQASHSISPEPRPKPSINISKRQKIPGINPELIAAYNAYQKQNFELSEKLYKRVLRRYPDNRDAVLGLAAIAMYQGRYATARDFYTRALKANPADSVARIALHSLIGSGDALKDGSRLKQWLQSDPGNPQLHFALGNYYAENRQWKEAQHAYFEAFRLAPSRADYAFNLAVTLDRLMLRKQALEYYRKAQELAGSTTLFSTRQLEQRITQLENYGGAKQ